MKESKELNNLIKTIIEHHKDLLWTSNVKNATNIDDFEKWCTVMAQQHAVITLKYMFTEEQFKEVENESDKIRANRVDPE